MFLRPRRSTLPVIALAALLGAVALLGGRPTTPVLAVSVTGEGTDRLAWRACPTDDLPAGGTICPEDTSPFGP